MEHAQGIDVAHYQQDGHPIDWPAVKAAGRCFACIKTTQGETGRDGTALASFTGARAAGLLVGGYHFFNPQKRGDTQAEHFARELARMGPQDLPPALDIESGNAADRDKIRAECAVFLKRVEQLTGWRPLVYTYPAFASEMKLGEVLGGWDLWIAHYGVKAPRIPPGWSSYRFWQFVGDKGTCPGVTGPCDGDVFNGSEQDLRNYCRDVRRPV